MLNVNYRRVGSYVAAAALLDLIDFAIAGDLFSHVIGICSMAFTLHFVSTAVLNATEVKL